MSAFEDLADRIGDAAKTAGLSFDRYDADFVLGVIMGWLDLHDLALDGQGLREAT